LCASGSRIRSYRNPLLYSTTTATTTAFAPSVTDFATATAAIASGVTAATAAAIDFAAAAVAALTTACALTDGCVLFRVEK
jgi:hypothetical protein